MQPLPDKLKDAVRKNNLVIFCGAGTSINLKNTKGEALGSWSNLVKQIIKQLNKGSKKYNYLLEALNHHEPIAVLDLIEKNKDIEKKDLYDFVKEFYELHADNNYDIQKKITKLSNIIITTNYDTAFEDCNQQLRNRTAYKGKNYELTTHKDDKPLLFKLHGCYSDVDSMVLFPVNYKDLYAKETRDAKHTLAVLKNLVFNKNILFMGCGMGDFQVNHIFKEIKEMQDGYGQPHYIISKQKPDSSLNFLKHIPVAEHSEIEGILNLLLEIKTEAENEKDIEKIEQQKQIEALQQALTESKSKYPILIEELFDEAMAFIENNEFEKACKKYEQITRLEELDVVFYNWGTLLGNFAKSNQVKEAEELYLLAIEKFQKAISIKPSYHKAFYNWGNVLGYLAESKEGKEVEELYEEACQKYQQAVSIKQDYHEAFYNWGTDLGILAKQKEGKEAEDLYRQAFEKYHQAVSIKPDKHQAFYNWGTLIGLLAKSKIGIEAIELYHHAFEKYEKAVLIKPDKHQAFYNWGNDLANLARLKDGKEAEALYSQAFEKYQQAVLIKPGYYEAFYNWGIDLVNLAKSKLGQKAEELYHQAFEKYQQVVSIKPDYHEAYYNWGNALVNLAKLQQGKETENFYRQALEKYQQAVSLKPDEYEAYSNWGNALLLLARTKEGEDALELYNQALDKCQKAFDLGGGCYNLACVHALKENKKEALVYLNLSLKNKEIESSYVKEDEDWKKLKEDEDFINLINNYA